MAQVDFLIIGAQKCGTTSLHMYMREHPGIFMPLQKELTFFSAGFRFAKGREWYLRHYFSKGEGKVCGEASPHYMYFRAVPGRIRGMFPGIKLIAILRNPIDRCYSHYSMAVRRGEEARTFREAIEEQAGQETVFPYEQAAGAPVDETAFYLAFGQYGRILKDYLELFGRERILLLFAEDLEKDPGRVVKKVFRFLGVDDSYVPKNLGKRYHAGGVKRFPRLEDLLFKQFLIRGIVRLLSVTRKNYETFQFWFKQYNIRPVDEPGPSEEDRAFLRSFYRNDVDNLQELFSVTVPWKDFRDKT